MENKSNPWVNLILAELVRERLGRRVCSRNTIFFGPVARGNWGMHCPVLEKPQRYWRQAGDVVVDCDS